MNYRINSNEIACFESDCNKKTTIIMSIGFFNNKWRGGFFYMLKWEQHYTAEDDSHAEKKKQWCQEILQGTH